MKKSKKISQRKLFDGSLSDETMKGIENLCNVDELDDILLALNQDF